MSSRTGALPNPALHSSTSAMAMTTVPPKVRLRHVFGFGGSTTTSPTSSCMSLGSPHVCFTDNDTLAYVAGRSTVVLRYVTDSAYGSKEEGIYRSETSNPIREEFLHIFPENSNATITTLAVCSKTQCLAVAVAIDDDGAEEKEKRTAIYLYDLESLRFLGELTNTKCSEDTVAREQTDEAQRSGEELSDTVTEKNGDCGRAPYSSLSFNSSGGCIVAVASCPRPTHSSSRRPSVGCMRDQRLDVSLSCWSTDTRALLCYDNIVGDESDGVEDSSMEVTFHPCDPSLLCLRLPGSMRLCFLRLFDAGTTNSGGKVLRPILSGGSERANIVSENDERDDCGESYQCHCWLDLAVSHVVLGTSSGNLVLFNGEDKRVRIPTDLQQVDALATTKFGFVACEGRTFLLFDVTALRHEGDALPSIRCTRRWSIKSTTTCVAPSLQEERCTSVVASPDGRMMGIHLEGANELCAIPTMSEKENDSPAQQSGTLVDRIDPIASSWTGLVSDMDVATCQPLLVTVWTDCHIRIFNYLNNECVLTKWCREEPLSVSVHPTGFHVLIGFPDRLRAMKVVASPSDLLDHWVFPVKACRVCRFARGGHRFVCAQGGITGTVFVYDFLTATKMAELRGHNSKVQDIVWNPTDDMFVSLAEGGVLYCWSLITGKRVGEHVLKGITTAKAQCGVCWSKQGLFVSVSNEIRRLSVPILAVENQYRDEGGMTFGPLVSLDSFLLFPKVPPKGVSGSISIASVVTPDIEYLAETLGDLVDHVLQMKVTACGRNIIASMSDNCLCVFSLDGPHERQKTFLTSARPGFEYDCEPFYSFSNIALVTRRSVEEKDVLVNEMHSKLEENRLANEYELAMLDAKLDDELRCILDHREETLGKQHKEIAAQRSKNQSMHLQFCKDISTIKVDHEQIVRELEAVHQQETYAEVKKYQALVRERDMEQRRLLGERNALAKTFQTEHSSLVTTMDLALQKEEERTANAKMENEDMSEELAKKEDQLEEDIDCQIEDLKQQYETKLAGEKESTLTCTGNYGITKMKVDLQKQEIEKQKELINVVWKQEGELQDKVLLKEGTLHVCQQKMQMLDGKICEVDKDIMKRERREQDLEAFKFCLEEKICQLEDLVQPREKELAHLLEQVGTLDKASQRYEESNSDFGETIRNTADRVLKMKRVVTDQRAKTNIEKARYDDLICSILKCSQLIQNPVQLKEHVSCCRNEIDTILSQQQPTNVVYGAECDTKEEKWDLISNNLEHSLGQLKMKHRGDTKDITQKSTFLMSKNLELLAEVQELRQSNGNYQQILQDKRRQNNLEKSTN